MSQREPTRHPSEEVLVLHASGQLDIPARVLVEAHVAHCQTCSRGLAELAVPGRRWLEECEEALPSSSLWEAIEARIDREASLDPLAGLGEVPLPAAARGELQFDGGPTEWRNLPLSRARFSILHYEAGTDTTLLLVRAEAGRRVPEHEHEGPEDVVVLAGGFEDPQGHFVTGDWQWNGAGTRHAPLVDEDGVCWIVARIEHGIHFTGLRGVLQRWGRTDGASGRGRAR